jgi:hypothetical protein
MVAQSERRMVNEAPLAPYLAAGPVGGIGGGGSNTLTPTVSVLVRGALWLPRRRGLAAAVGDDVHP